MSEKRRKDPIESVKTSLRKKAMDLRKFKGLPEQNKKKPEINKPPKNPAFFNPEEFSGDKPLMFDFRGIKGDQPEWVVRDYGKN